MSGGPAAGALRDGEPLRTDPRSFIVQAIGGLRNAVLPVAAAFFAFRDDGFVTGFAMALGAASVIVGLIAFSTWLSWRKLTYRIGDADIRVESGVLSRAARSVPFERIQDVSLEQAFLPRLFGLVEVRFETGAGGKDELKLAYLREAEGERLREVIRERRDDESTPVPQQSDGVATPMQAPEAARTLFAMGPRRLVTFGLFEFSLAILAVLFGVTQQFDFLLPFDLWDLDAWQDRLAGPGAQLAGLGPVAQAVGAVLALATLVVAGLATGLVRTMLRDWGFLLERTGKGFRRRRGLLTRTDVVMPVHRVQAIRIGTGLVRYRFGWHGLKFVSLAQDAGSANHDVAPFATLDEIWPIAREAGFDRPGDQTDWKRASARYRIDSVLMTLAMFAPIVAAVAIVRPGPWLLVPLAIAAFVIGCELYAWRFHHHALASRQIMAVRGLFAPRTDIASRVKLHSVELRQGPLAQGRGYATLHLGLAGGTMALHGLAIERARELRDGIVHSITATDFSQINQAGDAP